MRDNITFARPEASQEEVEAAANVDTATEQVIRRGLRGLLRGRTSFVIAHRQATVRDADKIVVLDAGRVVEEGTHDELMALRGQYYMLYTMGFETATVGAAPDAERPAALRWRYAPAPELNVERYAQPTPPG